MADLGARGLFVRIDDSRGGIVAVRAFFPDTIDTAVRQKTRWMTGIALSGWDRTGWARPRAFADHWMRMRDRRAPLSVVVLAMAYCALPAWALGAALHWYRGSTAAPGGLPGLWLLVANTVLLGWRLATRMIFTGRSYGLREALWSLPRFVVGNFVALNAAPRALVRYIGMLRGAAPVWDKTRHEFPDPPEMATADLR